MHTGFEARWPRDGNSQGGCFPVEGVMQVWAQHSRVEPTHPGLMLAPQSSLYSSVEMDMMEGRRTRSFQPGAPSTGRLEEAPLSKGARL